MASTNVSEGAGPSGGGEGTSTRILPEEVVECIKAVVSQLLDQRAAPTSADPPTQPATGGDTGAAGPQAETNSGPPAGRYSRLCSISYLGL